MGKGYKQYIRKMEGKDELSVSSTEGVRQGVGDWYDRMLADRASRGLFTASREVWYTKIRTFGEVMYANTLGMYGYDPRVDHPDVRAEQERVNSQSERQSWNAYAYQIYRPELRTGFYHEYEFSPRYISLSRYGNGTTP